MNNFRSAVLVPWSVALAAVASVAACGGGGTEAMSQPQSATGNRMQTLTLGPPGLSLCSDNVLPVLSAIAFGPPGSTGDTGPGDPVPVGTPVSVSVSFTDANPADIHTAQWNWGDGTLANTGVVDESARTVANVHTYGVSGLHTISVEVRDLCGGIDTATRQVVVYDPSAGFVTGGGWIVSPAGAYAADTTLSGRANFGFVSKYLKGANVPIGQTEFQFQTAGLNFHSDSYDWLVVAGARAQYKGVGTINGSGSYQFMLTAVDGNLLAGGKGPDRFRIKIWQDATIVYDNLGGSAEGGTDEGTVISGGSIVIHK